jgi:DNA-binding LacI/PurR family transcriptional regulator
MLTQLHLPPSRKQAMVEDLRRRIEAGDLAPGSKLLATKELAHHYGVAIQTAHNAVTELVRHGYLRRRTGHGTFVDRSTSPPANTVVGLAVNCEGDVWADFSAALVRGLSAMHVQPVIQDITALRSDLATLPAIAQRLLAARPSLVIAQSSLLARELRQAPGAPRVICIDSDPTIHGDFDRVVPDNYAIGYRAGELLAQAGCRRAAAYAIMVNTQGPWRPSAVCREIIAGGSAALAEVGGALTVIAGVLSGTDGRPTLEQLFADRPWPDGVFCTNTHRAVELLRHAAERGYPVPDQLPVVGVGETALAQAFELTTIDLSYDKVAAICLDLVREHLAAKPSAAWWRQYTVAPRVVVRNSCRPRSAAPTLHHGEPP